MARTVGVPVTGFNLRVTLSGGTNTERTIVKAFNRTTEEFREIVADENSVVFNLADLSSDGTSSGTFSGFKTNEVIEVRCHGGRMGSNTYTITAANRTRGGGQVTVTVADVTATNTPGLNV